MFAITYLHDDKEETIADQNEYDIAVNWAKIANKGILKLILKTVEIN